MSNIADLCDGVAAALNGASFSQAFTAAYEFAPNYSSMDAKTLRVIVTDAGGEAALIARGMVGYTDTVRVVVIARVDAGATGLDTAKIRAALTLLEEIGEHLIARAVAGYSPQGTFARATGDKDHSHYMPGNLEDRVFAASILIPYETRASLRAEGGS